jgi:catechol 2,3-dioxygenase-like lactoylglutathione lyase family enzyme
VSIVGLDHVQLAAPAGCEAEARAFFGDLLGLAELEKPPALGARGGVWFALPDGRQLHIGVEREFVPATKAHPAFRVDGYERLLTHFGAAEDDAIPGLRRFYASDPWGNRLEFIATDASN